MSPLLRLVADEIVDQRRLYIFALRLCPIAGFQELKLEGRSGDPKSNAIAQKRRSYSRGRAYVLTESILIPSISIQFIGACGVAREEQRAVPRCHRILALPGADFRAMAWQRHNSKYPESEATTPKYFAI